MIERSGEHTIQTQMLRNGPRGYGAVENAVGTEREKEGVVSDRMRR